ncbi:AP2 domain-containing protein [Clostridiaceae bacterium OM08-6BH]|nr:AP2 domain-containing protein [Clostridiaceae bacterium OM08-6BH]
MSGSNAKNILGNKYGRLTVIEYVGRGDDGRALWKCKCECGNYKVVSGDALRQGHSKSCGCLQKENRQMIIYRNRYGNLKHAQTSGGKTTRIYRIWDAMIQRCCNPKHDKFYRYGGRGINVCAEWKNNFEEFYSWAKRKGYDETLTIDRINNDGNYEPGNCRWTNMTIQGLNRGLQSNNTTGHKGVSYLKKTGKYRAYIKIHGKQVWLGAYDTIEEAIRARKKAEQKYMN